MKITKLLGVLLFVLSLNLAAQSNKLDKKMQKVYDLVDKDKIKEAGEKLEELLNENPEYGQGWDYLSKIRYKEYKDAKLADNLFNGKVTITTKDKNGKEIKKEDDTLGNSLLKLLSEIKPSKKAFNKYLYFMRKGLLTSPDADHCSVVLRNYYIDPEVDTAVSKKALKYFNEAEEEFSKKNYADAAKMYKRALEEQPDFFKASLYMGDCFFFVEDYVNAIASFKAAKQKFPQLLEPRKYLIDAYAKSKLYDLALNEAIETMAVYPDLSVIAKMEDAAYLINKKINIQWTPRRVFPNSFKTDSLLALSNSFSEELKPAKDPWNYYLEAKSVIKPVCNSKGLIVKPTSLSMSHYMEVYSWEEMLKKSKDPMLDQARKMQEAGFLDCYVLVTCYHIDFYDQYLDFVTKNKAKVVDYYKKFLVARD
ncbi:MAG: tetratricopeptide repeat protein [Bacteroidia bacterium]|nr:tetratricopeptide repeat protein [Bacteroidia bacterium]